MVVPCLPSFGVVLHPLSLLILLGDAAFSVPFLWEVLLPPPPPPAVWCCLPPPPLGGAVLSLFRAVVLLSLLPLGGAALLLSQNCLFVLTSSVSLEWCC